MNDTGPAPSGYDDEAGGGAHLPAHKANTGALSAVMEAEMQRAIAEVQAARIMAKRFPRVPAEVMDGLKVACGELELAEESGYVYKRGGSIIAGPSIRLAEVLALNWGNIDFGVSELGQRDNASTVQAVAVDLQTGTRSHKVFEVSHVRHTRKGSYTLKDPRDIYELVANNGSRRLRACILAVIPKHVQNAALKMCEETLLRKGGSAEEVTERMKVAFAKIGVTEQMLGNLIGHPLPLKTGYDVIYVRRVYKAIRDGITDVQREFGMVPQYPDQGGDKKETTTATGGEGQQPGGAGTGGLKDKLRSRRGGGSAAKPAEAPASAPAADPPKDAAPAAKAEPAPAAAAAPAEWKPPAGNAPEKEWLAAMEHAQSTEQVDALYTAAQDAVEQGVQVAELLDHMEQMEPDVGGDDTGGAGGDA